MKPSITKQIFVLFLAVMMAFSSLPLALAEDAPEVTDQSDYNVESTNSLGNMLAATVEATAADPNEGFFISDLAIEGDKATVTFQNAAACDLVIAAYDEDTMEMLCSDTARVAAGADTAELTLTNLTAENMIVKAFLLDDSHQALCKNYTFREYSKDYKDFISKTVADFDEEQVINLDEAEDNNFLVLNEEAKTVSPTEEANHIIIADFEEDTFVFSDADSAITGLKEGDLFYYALEDMEELIIIRVKSVTVDKDNTATVKGEQVALEDAFEYVKIDVDVEDEDFEALDETAAEISAEENQVAPRNATDLNPEHTFTKSFSLNWPKKEDDDSSGEDKDDDGKVSFKLHGTGSFSATAKFRVYLSKKYKEVSFVITTELKLDFGAEMEIKAVEKKLGEFGIHPIPGLFIGINPTFVFTISGKLSTNVTFGFDLGGQWDSKDGFTNKCRKLEPDFDGIELEATVFVGIDLKPKARLISDKVVKAELSGTIGFELKGKMSWLKSGGRVVHLCKNCLDGSLAFTLDITFKVVFAEGKHGWIVSEKKYELPILNLTIPICDFYWSFTYGKHGGGKCPYHLVKVDFVVRDADDDKALEKALIASGTMDDMALEYNGFSFLMETDKDGKASYYYPVGSYTVSASCTDYITKQMDEINVEYLCEADEYYVNDSSEQATIVFNLERCSYTVTGTVMDEENGKPLSGGTVIAKEPTGGEAAIEITDKDGKFTMQLDSGNYNFFFSMVGYVSVSDSKDIKKNTDIGTVKLKKDSASSEEPHITQNPDNLKTGDQIQFGTYPQRRVTDTTLIAKLDSVDKQWTSYGYYTCANTDTAKRGDMETEDYMRFADFFCDGIKYRAVTFDTYRPYTTTRTTSLDVETFQREHGYECNQIYYFLYEPISWYILDPQSGLIACEYLLDSQAYQNVAYYSENEWWSDVTSKLYANNYAQSSIRVWLQKDFYESAFTDEQKQLIFETTLDNRACRNDYSMYDAVSTKDSIFLLSWDEVESSLFNGKDGYGTDYALSQGLYTSWNSSYWALRSAGKTSSGVSGLFSWGALCESIDSVFATSNGIRPACCLSILTSDISQSDDLFSQRKNSGAKPAPRKINSAPAGAAELLGFSARNVAPLTASRADAVKGEEYVLLVVKDAAAENPLAADNLLYIDQQTAASATVTFTYVPREEFADAVATIYGPDKDSHVHQYAATETKEPTCTEPGETTYTCPCGDSYTEAVPAAGHTMTKTEAKAPTCAEPGNAAYYTCSVCGKTFGDEKGETELTETTIPATGEHTYSEWAVTKPATVEAEGEETRTCSVCGENETRTISKLTPETPAHTLGDVDGDNEVTSGDARLALRASVKLEQYEEGSAAFLAADVDGNGAIESSDARTILRVSVKLEAF